MNSGTQDTRAILIESLGTLFSNIDGKKVGRADDPRYEALQRIDQNWDDIIYEDFWKAIIETSNIDVQSKAISILLEKRGIKAYGRIFRYIESGRIADTEFIATSFARLLFEQMTGDYEDADLTYSVTVLSKSFTREKSGIYVLLRPMVETLLDLLANLRFDHDYSERYEPTHRKIVEFLTEILDGMAKDMLPHVVSMFTTSAKSTKFTRFMLSEVELPSNLSAMLLLKRRAGIIRLSKFKSIIEDHSFHPVTAFLLRKLVSFHEIERYNAANILKDVLPGFYGEVDNEGQNSYSHLMLGPHSDSFHSFLQSLEDTRLSFRVVLSFLKLNKKWNDLTDDDLGKIVKELNYNLHMRDLTSGVKKLDYTKNIEQIEEIKPVELNAEESKFVQTLEREHLLHKFYEENPEPLNPLEQFTEMYPEAPEDIVQVLFLMDRKTVLKLEEIGYLLYLLEAEEFSYTSMVERKSELVTKPEVEEIYQFISYRSRRFLLRNREKGVKLGDRIVFYNDETFDLLAFNALYLPLIITRFIRTETNPKILEIVLRVFVGSIMVRDLPRILGVSLAQAILIALEREITVGVESRLISLFYQTIDTLGDGDLESLVIKLEQKYHIPLFAGFHFFIRARLKNPNTEYEGTFAFRNLEVTVRMTKALLDLLIDGHSEFQDEFFNLISGYRKYGERYIPMIDSMIKENLDQIPESVKSHFSNNKDLVLRVLFSPITDKRDAGERVMSPRRKSERRMSDMGYDK